MGERGSEPGLAGVEEPPSARRRETMEAGPFRVVEEHEGTHLAVRVGHGVSAACGRPTARRS